MPSNSLLRVREGEFLTAAKWNALVQLASRRVTGPNVFESSGGFHIRSPIVPVPSQVVQLLLTGWTNNGFRFECTEFDDNGDSKGDIIIVHARSYPPSPVGRTGRQDLRLCDPNFVIGDYLLCEHMSIWDGRRNGQGRFEEGLFAERGAAFMLECSG